MRTVTVIIRTGMALKDIGGADRLALARPVLSPDPTSLGCRHSGQPAPDTSLVDVGVQRGRDALQSIRMIVKTARDREGYAVA